MLLTWCVRVCVGPAHWGRERLMIRSIRQPPLLKMIQTGVHFVSSAAVKVIRPPFRAVRVSFENLKLVVVLGSPNVEC